MPWLLKIGLLWHSGTLDVQQPPCINPQMQPLYQQMYTST